MNELNDSKNVSSESNNQMIVIKKVTDSDSQNN
jgi:hypothetical protein